MKERLSERPLALMRIIEAPGLYCDAALTDEDNSLVFLSVWGRDTAIQELRGRLTLPAADGGLHGLRLASIDDNGSDGEARLAVRIRNRDELRNRTTRVQTSIYGQQVNLWIYEASVSEPDMANRHAVMLYENASTMIQSRWLMLKQLCHLPLLDTWQASIINAFEQDELIRYQTGFGLNAVLFDLDTEKVEQRISLMLRGGVLPLP